MSHTSGWNRTYPYYKVQVFNDRVFAWKDEKRAFDSAEDARSYIGEELAQHRTRIIIVEGERNRRVLEPDE